MSTVRGKYRVKEGDTAEISLPYCRHPFTAKIRRFLPDGRMEIVPIERWPTWRTVKVSDVSERLDPPRRRRRKRVVG